MNESDRAALALLLVMVNEIVDQTNPRHDHANPTIGVILFKTALVAHLTYRLGAAVIP